MTVHYRVLLIILLIALPCALFAGEIVLPFTSGEAAITAGSEGLFNLKISGFSGIGLPGDPALPFTRTHVLLPPGVKLKTLRIELRSAVEEEIEGTFSVAPSPPPVISADNKIIEDWRGRRIKNGRNADVYDRNELFPAGYVTTGHTSGLGRYVLLPVSFWPYRYNPVTGRLAHLVKADVAIIFDTTPAAQNPSRADRDMLPKLKRLAANWQKAESWYGVSSVEAQPASPVPIAIITTSQIVSESSSLADFVAHKTAMGFSVTVATEANWGGGTGNIAAERIRAWLRANYAQKARYAILIGNPNPSDGTVPMKMLWPRRGATDGYESCPSDYYYADVTGNWDLDGDGYYGEENGDFGEGGVDRVPEVIVGRIPYYGVMTELDKILRKIITYETTTEIGPWAQRVLIAQKPLDGLTPTWQAGEGIKNDVCKPAGLNYYRVYENDFGLMPAPEKTPCNYDNMKNEWMKGYGFVFWGSHGWAQGASDVVNSSLCSLFDDSRPAFIFQGSCTNGYPEAIDNLGYSLLKNGAIDTVSASRVSWYYYHCEVPYKETDCIFGMCYRYALRLAKDRERCGDALYNMKTSLEPVIWMNHLVFNLYGDPTIIPRWPSTALSVETASLPSGKVSRYYEIDLQAAGGVAPYSWSIDEGTLPPGLTLSESGTVSGVPTKSGTYGFTVKVAEDGGNYAAKAFSIAVSITAYYFDLNTDPGWTCQGGWALGTPGGNGDPTYENTNNWIYGYNLGGNYPNNMASTEYLTTQAIDCSSLAETKLSFQRSLGVQGSDYDKANIQISTNGTDWTTIWSNPASTISDTCWIIVSYDISQFADGKPAVYIRWGMGPTDATTAYPGWNIDEVSIEGILTKPLIRHTPITWTDAATGSYAITADVLSSYNLLPGSPVLYWKTNGEFASVPMDFVDEDTFEAAIPAQPEGSVVKYYIAAADYASAALSPAAAPTTLHQFSVIPDNQPPVVLHTPHANTTDCSGYYEFRATVVDNLGVGSVMLTWSRNGSIPEIEKMELADGPGKYFAAIMTQAEPGDWFSYKITATDTSQSLLTTESPESGWHIFSILPGQVRIHSFTLDTNPGWTCGTGWEFGQPHGKGSNAGDPFSGFTGSNVYGYNLSGDYQNSMTEPSCLTTSAIDCTGASNVTLEFRRWLGVEGRAKDSADIEISTGSLWKSIWSNPANDMMDYNWELASYDISQVADRQPAVYIRWGIGPTNATLPFPGWNIDDVEIWADLYAPINSIGDLKAAADLSSVESGGYVVTAVFPGFFYMQKPGEYQGIRVAWPGIAAEGDTVSVRGVMRTRCFEREIIAQKISADTPAGSIKPVGMGLNTLGGANMPQAQAGVKNGCGLNNIGTLVKVWGKVTRIGDGYFYLDDGSGLKDGTATGNTPNIGVRALHPGTGLSQGQFVIVIGISTGFSEGESFLRAVLPKINEGIIP